MVILGVSGTPKSGKRTVANLLCAHGEFSCIDLALTSPEQARLTAMQEWSSNFVVYPINVQEHLEFFRKRPSFLLVVVSAPLVERIRRSGRIGEKDVEATVNFIAEEDRMQFASANASLTSKCIWHDGDIEILNDSSLGTLKIRVQELLVGHCLHWALRPPWPIYFMRLAYLAATRSSCMKRRVGCIVAKNNKVISTGYNGTPFGITNCNEGGCGRCLDASITQGKSLDECVCVHAEANALLAAGIDAARGANLFVTCSPCLSCAKLIVQSGIANVIYCDDYHPQSGALLLLDAANIRVQKTGKVAPKISPQPFRPVVFSLVDDDNTLLQ